MSFIFVFYDHILDCFNENLIRFPAFQLPVSGASSISIIACSLDDTDTVNKFILLFFCQVCIRVHVCVWDQISQLCL